MDLIQLIIELIGKAFESPNTRRPSANNPNDIVRQIQVRIEAARLQEPGPAQRPPQRAAPGPMMARLPQPGRAQATAFKGRKIKRNAPPALPAAAIATPAAKAAVPPKVAPPPAAKPALTNVDAKVLARWLRPQTLRTQFILTEIFQPPVTLRESHLF